MCVHVCMVVRGHSKIVLKKHSTLFFEEGLLLEDRPDRPGAPRILLSLPSRFYVCNMVLSFLNVDFVDQTQVLMHHGKHFAW